MHQTTRRLTNLQQRFVTAYLRDGRAVAAARQAGYSAATATHSSGRLMRAPHIRAAIADGRARQERHGDRLRDRVVRELERIAFDAPDDATQRPLDRLRALDLLGRMAERDLRRDSRRDPQRDPQRDQGADTASVDTTTQPPAWEEQFRRGMERVERGRCKDAERARRKEADDVSKQAETTVSLDVPAAHASPQEKIGTEKNEAGEGTGAPEASEGKNAEEEKEEADWRRRRAYLSRCYPLTHWPEEAAFYERMGRFAPT